MCNLAGQARVRRLDREPLQMAEQGGFVGPQNLHDKATLSAGIEFMQTRQRARVEHTGVGAPTGSADFPSPASRSAHV